MAIVSTTSGFSFSGTDNKSIVDAAINAGLFFPYSCKNGRCKSCMCQLLSGSTKLLCDETGLTDDEKKSGWILACARAPVSELTIDAVGVSNQALPEVKTLPCRISELVLLSGDVIKVVLRLPPGTQFRYLAGQYIDIIKGDIKRSYSIANNGVPGGTIELHIKRFADGLMSEYWFEHAQVNDLLRLNGPLGTFFLRDIATKNLIFLATGTGFAPIKALLESLSQLNVDERPKSLRVYWGGRKASDFYEKVPDIGFPYAFNRVLSRDLEGRALEYVQDVCLADVSDFQDTQVFACGSVSMIDDAKHVLFEAGLNPADFFSDAFLSSGFRLTEVH